MSYEEILKYNSCIEIQFHELKSLKSYLYTVRVYTCRKIFYVLFISKGSCYIYLSQKLNLRCFFPWDVFVNYEEFLKYNSVTWSKLGYKGSY